MDEIGDQIRALMQRNEYEAAIALCDQALAASEGKDRSHLWRLRAYVHERVRKYELAAEDVSFGLAEQPGQLSLLFVRAAVYVELRRFIDANADLDQLLAIEGERGEEFFNHAALILQAICLDSMDRPNEALAISERLPREVRTWALGRLWRPDEFENAIRGRLAGSNDPAT